MTNVVGILVIMLVVTQLGVNEAVERISDTIQIDPEEFAAAMAQAEAARAEREALEAQLAALASSDTKVDPRQLAKIQRQILDQQADLKSLREARQDELADIEKKIQEALTAQQELNKQEAELKAKLDEKAAELARLLALLESTPEREVLPAKVVNLPNPRPAPEGAERISFICREGKIGFLDEDKWTDSVTKYTTAMVARGRYGNLQTGIDCERLFDDFDKLRRRDVNFEIHLVAKGRYPFLEFRRREFFGETVEEIREPGSRLASDLQVNPRQYYCRFLVWPDSFEIYLEAREMADKQNLLAGWQPMTSAGEYMIRLPGKLRCGPPPPPAPKPTNPPPAKPPKPPPPRPTDVID